MYIPAIPPLDHECQRAALKRQSVLTKPAGALGRLEALSVRLAGMTGRLDWLPTYRLAIVCAADHGVAAQGVSAYPAEVTQQMVLNFLRGGAAVNVLARQMNARVLVIDAGVAAEFDPHPSLMAAKIGHGTADFTCGPAMTDTQAAQCIETGIRIAQQQIERGADLLAVGEMGIAVR